NATSSAYTFTSPTWTWEDDLSLHRGKHNVSLGVRVMRTYYRVRDNDVREAGSYTYSGQNTGTGLTDFMLGRPTAFEQQNRQFANIHATYFGAYFQDDIKLTPRLSVNLGLRYELPFAQVDEDGKETVFLPGSTAKSTVFKNAPAGLLFYGDPGISRSGRGTPKKQLGPRAGLSYALTADQKTVLRAGYGLLYSPTWTNVEGQYINRQPWVSRFQVAVPFSTSDPWRNQPSFPTGNPFPVEPRDPNFVFRNAEIFSYLPNYVEPNSQHWNLNLQKELAHDYLITLAYVGTKGTHLLLRHDRNAATYLPGRSTLANLNDRRPFYQPLTIVEMVESGGNSSFHSGQISLDKRFSKGFSILTSYTFGKSIDTQAGGYTPFPQDPNDYSAERGPSSYDRTHAFVNSVVWDLPTPVEWTGLRRQVIGGWQVSGIVQLYSGTPLGMATSQDRALRGLTNRPDRLRAASLDASRPRAEKISRYFDPTAYVANQTGLFGSAPRSDSRLRGPGSIDTNVSVSKQFRITERQKLLFRTEFFNIVNRPNFGNPGTNVDTPATFGRINSAGDGRIIQFALKYMF
ncbi:MAG: TonB-dependent receptor, partial [Bryobacteraceae bacterium]